jgi:tetratricopeptide (TPR) repeat protein
MFFSSEEALLTLVIDVNLLSSEGIELSVEQASIGASVGQTEMHTLDDGHSIRMWQDAVDKEPLNYWLWHNLCRLYSAMNNLDGAIDACKLGLGLGVTDSRINPSPLMVLTNLYAAKGHYEAAIALGIELVNIKPAILLLALKDPKRPLIAQNLLEW